MIRCKKVIERTAALALDEPLNGDHAPVPVPHRPAHTYIATEHINRDDYKNEPPLVKGEGTFRL